MCKHKDMDKHSEFMSTAEVAKAFEKSVPTITRWVAAGKLTPTYKGEGIRGFYLFDRADVEALLERTN